MSSIKLSKKEMSAEQTNDAKPAVEQQEQPQQEQPQQQASVTKIGVDQLVEQLVPVVTEKMATSNIVLSPSTVMKMLRIAMEAVEGAPIKGEQQKELAIKVIMEIATNVDLPEEQKALIKSVVDGGIVSDTIDLIIDATRGKLDINKAADVAKGCFTRLFRAFFRKQSEEEKLKKEELKNAKIKAKKDEYKKMVKTIRERETERERLEKEEYKKVIRKIRQREAKKVAKKEENNAKKEAKRKEREEKKQNKQNKKNTNKKNKKQLPELNIPEEGAPSSSKSGSVKVPSELNFPALSSNLPESVVNENKA